MTTDTLPKPEKRRAFKPGDVLRKYAAQRGLFDSMLDDIVDDMPADASGLFSASAYEAIPMSATSTVERSEIDRNAWRAYSDYCEAAAADMEAQAIDHAYDTARDERLMGAA